jgi:hypothetical protein
MDLAKLNILIAERAENFDFNTLSNKSIDPFVHFVLVESSGGIKADTVTIFLTEGPVIHHRNRPQDCLAFAMKLSARIIQDIPFKKEKVIKDHCAQALGFPLNNSQYLIVTSIAGNFEDAQWVTEAFRSCLYSQK